MEIQLKPIYDLIKEFKLETIPHEQSDLDEFNKIIKQLFGLLDIEQGQYLYTIPKIKDKYMSDTKVDDLNSYKIKPEYFDFIKDDLSFDEQTQLRNIEKKYLIEMEKQILSKGSSPFLIYFRDIPKFPDERSKQIYFFLNWWYFREYIKLEKKPLDFMDIAKKLLLLINEETIKKYLEQYKNFILHCPTMDKPDNITQELRYKQYFEEKTIQLCYVLDLLTDGLQKPKIMGLVQVIINELKQYQTLIVFVLMDIMFYYLTLLDFQQHGIRLAEIDKDTLQAVIQSRYDPNRTQLFTSVKHLSEHEGHDNIIEEYGSGENMQKDQTEMYNRFIGNLPHFIYLDF